ncbi:MAG: hypothetical protein ACYC40_02815 [Patescibacteria group bacterium]
MFSTSIDILNLVLAVCIVFLSFFLCWAIYYFVVSAQMIHRLVKRIELGVTKVEGVIETAQDKLRNSSAYFMILAEIAKKAMEFVQEKRAEKKTGKKKK